MGSFSGRRRWAAAAMAMGLSASACRIEAPPSEHEVSETSAEQVTIGSIQWYVDYDAALEVAKAQDKALWVHFGENPG